MEQSYLFNIESEKDCFDFWNLASQYFRDYRFCIGDKLAALLSLKLRTTARSKKCLVIFFAVRERGVLQSASFQLRTRSERENGNSADVERSRLAGRYLEVPTFGAGAPPCFLVLLWA